MNPKNIYPAITLYQPWATWVIDGWKTIETRTHNRFGCLLNKTILIHAGQQTDLNAWDNNPYLTQAQLQERRLVRPNGYILGIALVKSFGKLSAIHSHKALIDCENTERFGLYLTDVEKFKTPIPCKGGMGIWYYNLDECKKVKKERITKQQSTLEL